MSYRSIAFMFLCLVAFFVACTKTPEPIDIVGNYDVILFQVNDCNDSTANRLHIRDSSFCFLDTFIDADRCLSDVSLSITESTYTFERTETSPGQSTMVMEEGNYERVDNNNFIFCSPECEEVLVVLIDDLINIVRTDTISGCGSLLRARR